MNKLRPFYAFAVAAVAGGITPWLIPSDWFSYVLCTCIVGLVVFASLAAHSAKPNEPDRFGIIWWFVIGTDRPTAKINDPDALAIFFLIVVYLAGFTAGVFGAVHT